MIRGIKSSLVKLILAQIKNKNNMNDPYLQGNIMIYKIKIMRIERNIKVEKNLISKFE
jgi:hypothetical protein